MLVGLLFVTVTAFVVADKVNNMDPYHDDYDSEHYEQCAPEDKAVLEICLGDSF